MSEPEERDGSIEVPLPAETLDVLRRIAALRGVAPEQLARSYLQSALMGDAARESPEDVQRLLKGQRMRMQGLLRSALRDLPREALRTLRRRP